MTWTQAEKAVRSGQPVRHKYWTSDAHVELWRGHLIRVSRRGNVVTRRWFSLNGHRGYSQTGWELA